MHRSVRVYAHRAFTNPHRTVSDPVDLDDRLVPATTSAADDEGEGDDRGHDQGADHRFVLDRFLGLIDGADQLLRFALDVIPVQRQLRSSIR